MNKIVFITGASSGIGEACAYAFGANGYNLVITGRRIDRLEKLQLALRTAYNINIKCLCFDVRDRGAVFSSIESLPAEWKNIDILVNNAGLALGRDSFENADLDDWEQMLHTNVDGLLFVSKAIVPLMVARRSG